MNNWRSYILGFLCIVIVFYEVPSSHTNATGAPSGYSGSVSDLQNTCETCHSNNIVNSLDSNHVLISSELDYLAHYNLGQSYFFAITASSFMLNKFGFQACVENELGEKIGTLVIADAIQTQLVGDGTYITHTQSGSQAIGVSTWVFNWIAPMSQQGDAVLHTSVLFSNNDGTTQGDQVLYESRTFAEPNFGCTDPEAFNFNPENDLDDGSCLYSLNSETLSLSFQNLTVSGSFGEELAIQLNVHNTSDESLLVHASRMPTQLSTPTNWFCWGACYTPSVSESASSLEISAGSYLDEFSGHLMAGLNPGNYPIEYCFYAENAIDDSICATVTYKVLGDVYGCIDPNALNYNASATVDDLSCILFPTPLWEFSESYGGIHSIALNTDADITINDSNISVGDWIGVFYETDSGLVCAGYTLWLGENVNLTVHGFDPESEQGFLLNDEFIWQVWDASEGVSWPMIATYSPLQPNNQYFQIDGFSSILTMSNINPISSQDFDIPNGWSIFSTYISNLDMNAMTLFEPIVDDLIIVKNNNGEAYIVEYQFNAIGDFVNGQGYLMKTNLAVNLVFNGDYVKPIQFPISLQEGWNMVGYLYTESVHSAIVFEELLDQDLIQIAKDYQGNALIPGWEFNGLGMMNPGEGYQLKVYEQAVLQY